MAMQAEHGSLLPLIALKSADEYTTVHACNVAMLSMGLAEQLSFSSQDVRAIGVAALLHDIGKVRLPESLLNKPGVLTDAERAIMRTHTVEGARLLGERGAGYGLASIVAYEHHVWANGQGGYPDFRFPRPPHFVTRLVQVCDVYDALSTQRPYRAAWPRARTLHHMRLQAGRELDYDLLLAFFDLLDRAEKRQVLPF
jgi:putative nucleotidyltransferase with HDIG domain